jgi:hypothetical protein
MFLYRISDYVVDVEADTVVSHITSHSHLLHRLKPPPDADAAPGMICGPPHGAFIGITFGSKLCDERDRTAAVFNEVLQLAQAALEYLENPENNMPGNSVERYFGVASIVTVKDVLLVFLKSPEAARVSIVNPEFRTIAMSYGVPLPPGQLDGRLDHDCDGLERSGSHTTNIKGNPGKLVPADAEWGLVIPCSVAYELADLPSAQSIACLDFAAAAPSRRRST